MTPFLKPNWTPLGFLLQCTIYVVVGNIGPLILLPILLNKLFCPETHKKCIFSSAFFFITDTVTKIPLQLYLNLEHKSGFNRPLSNQDSPEEFSFTKITIVMCFEVIAKYLRFSMECMTYTLQTLIFELHLQKKVTVLLPFRINITAKKILNWGNYFTIVPPKYH